MCYYRRIRNIYKGAVVGAGPYEQVFRQSEIPRFLRKRGIFLIYKNIWRVGDTLAVVLLLRGFFTVTKTAFSISCKAILNFLHRHLPFGTGVI